MIILTDPYVINKIGCVFHVGQALFDWDNGYVRFDWSIKTQNGEIVKTGSSILENREECVDEEFIFNKIFTDWYNNSYLTHQDLVSKAAEISGFSDGNYINKEVV